MTAAWPAGLGAVKLARSLPSLLTARAEQHRVDRVAGGDASDSRRSTTIADAVGEHRAGGVARRTVRVWPSGDAIAPSW